jgi:rhizoxin synthesis polyketide synthase RhiC
LLGEVYRFDAPFFNISRREAEVMDPHMRLLLEAVWSCIENAGYQPRAIDKRTGVFISFYNHEYASLLDELEVEPASKPYLATGTTAAIFANRISFLLGLNGPSEVYDTACSSALVALHRSIQAISSGDCRQAIVAGASLLLTPARVEALSAMGILNQTGICNPYSNPANQEIIGEGVGALMVKPLAQAVEDRDYIYAVIRGTDVNHHGNRSGRMTLPSADALAELLATTYGRLGIGPDRIRYVEGHGAGSDADVVELQSVQRFLEDAGLKRGKVPIGSVKGNIGFGEASGGIAQLTKCALALHHNQIPATINFTKVDPVFDLEASHLVVQSEKVTLEETQEDACLSILAYGLGGTNAHVILSGHKNSPLPNAPAQAPIVFLLSAQSQESLDDYVRVIKEHLETSTTISRYRSICGSEGAVLFCIARTLAERERHAKHRVVFVTENLHGLLECCANYLSGANDPRIIRQGVPSSNTASESAWRWIQGDDAASTSCVGTGAYQKLPLPGVPFHGEIYRLLPRTGRSANIAPSLEERWQVTRYNGRTVIDLAVTSDDCFISDHLVDGVAIMPAAAYVALLFRIARKLYNLSSCSIENLAWTMPFQPTNGIGTLRVEISESGSFRIFHAELQRLCCKGLFLLQAALPPVPSPTPVKASALERLSPVLEKQAYWAIANAPATRQNHGVALRRLSKIYRTGDKLVGVMEPSSGVSPFSDVAFLDSALCACRGLSTAEEDGAQAVVPFAAERIRLLKPLPVSKPLYAAVEERRGTLTRYDISIEDGADDVYVLIEGYFPKPFAQLTTSEDTSARPQATAKQGPLETSSLRALLLRTFTERIAAFLKCDVNAVPTEGSLAPLGLDSIAINALTDEMSQKLGFDLPATLFFEHAHLLDLVEHLLREFPSELASFASTSEPTTVAGPTITSPPQEHLEIVESAHTRPGAPTDIAIIGMGGFFPGARNVRELWRKLREGQDLVTEMPETRRQSVYRIYAEAVRELKGIYGGFVEDADKFDADFFGFSEREVLAMDPQQRLFLEAAWTAIEDAGYYPPSLSGRKVGVYVGAIVNDYAGYLQDIGYPVSMFHEGTGSSLAGIANRLSYFLNLTGPSQAIDTACCSSLYAVDRAVTDLSSGRCETAVAGGVSFACTPGGYQMYAAMNYLAKDWRCKAFAEGGDGWSKAEIFAAVFLKRYDDAIRDKDPIYAVIRATGVNHGGKGYFYTQPNSARHVDLIREVYRKGRVDPRSIIHMEAHGSGTEMGDALEFNSLSRALREFAQENQVSLSPNQCGLGSIKSNFGHAEAGSGIAGLIKTVLMLHHQVIPPTLHIKNLNKHIRLQQSPLYVAQQAKPFLDTQARRLRMPRCGGVHSFNFSGAAAHVLVAEHLAEPEPGSLGLTRFPLCLSAKTPQTLATYCRDIAQFVKVGPQDEQWLERLIYTINRSKSYFAYRLGFIVNSVDELVAKLGTVSSTDINDVSMRKATVSQRRLPYPALVDETVDVLMERWLTEADFDWTVVMAPFRLTGLHLPSYPFEHSRSYFPEAGAPTAFETTGQPVSESHQTGAQLSAPTQTGSIEERLITILSQILTVAPETIDLDRGVGDYGFDSLRIASLSEALNTSFGLQTTPPDLFEFATPRQMVEFIAASAKSQPLAPTIPVRQNPGRQDGVAIVGMSGQFPGAADLEEFWANLVNGKDAITEIPPDRWNWQEVWGDPRREPNKTNVRWGGFIRDVTTFDPLFFRISPREAEAMDPQQRLLMMYVWRVIEDAGYRPSSLAGTNTGLFIATGSTHYGAHLDDAGSGEAFGSTGSIPSIGPNRMSHFLDLHGPSEPVETSCSSSLVAIHRAVLSIQAGECEQAIAGGINSIVAPDDHIAFSKAGMLCEDGRCKTFSDQANGYVRGEGVGMLLLKPLAAAEAAGDHIYGVIRGSVVNHGGRSNSLTAPNPKAQAELLRTAYSQAGIDPRTVGYIEAHGTGTALGDPIEINGLKTAFKSLYEASVTPEVSGPHCALASVKTNIGHLELAAGVAGIIKLLLQLKYQTLVKSLHCARLNPYIQLQGSPFYILLENRPWPQILDRAGTPLPRRAGVSSFGFGGVNAHIVLEEYSQATVDGPKAVPPSPQLIVLSAKNETRLAEALVNLRDFLDCRPETQLADLAYTLQVGRDEMEARIAFVATSLEQVRKKLWQITQEQSPIEGCARATSKQQSPAPSPSLRGLLLATEADLSRLANHWVSGGVVDWEGLWGQSRPRRISLPTYPFARERCWYQAVSKDATSPAEPAPILDAPLFIPRWEEAGPYLSEWSGRAPHSIVVVHCGPATGLSAALAAECRERFPTADFTRIEIADHTRRLGPGEWQCGESDPRGFAECLSSCASIDSVFFVSRTANGEPGHISQDVIQLLRLAKAIQNRLGDADAVDFFVLADRTTDTVGAPKMPAGAELAGLAYSLAQGDHRFRARNLVISTSPEDQLPVSGILAEPPSHRGELIQLHSGARFRQRLFAFKWPTVNEEGFRRQGVYVILGGNGHVGGIITRELLLHYQAKVVWLGRTPEHAPEVRTRLQAFDGTTPKPLYVQADALDVNSLRQAIQRIKTEYGCIHGAIFAGSVFSFENRVTETSESDFRNILEIKTQGSLNFYAAIKDEPLDFLCFFSSAQAFAFSGAASFSAYAAGITFTDSLALFLNATASFPVGTINWGFWASAQGDTKAVENAGVLDAKSGFMALQHFISSLRARILPQVVCLNTTPAVRDLMPLETDRLLWAPGASTLQPPGIVPYSSVMPPPLVDVPSGQEFETWMTRLLFVQIRDLSLLTDDTSSMPPEGLRPWLREARRLLTERGADINPDAPTADVWAQWDRRKHVLSQDRQLGAQIALVDECLRKLPRVLKGEMRPTDVLFPNASMELVERLYTDNAQFAYFSRIVAEAVCAYLKHQRESQPAFKARILEVGAGTGGTTSAILTGLGGLASCIDEYCYTDVSRAFLEHGERSFSPGRPFLRFRILDIEKTVPPHEAGLGAYDVVIAANVLHATRDIRKTIRHAKAFLKCGGLLILDEIAGPSQFAHLTFGLLPGWWLSEDPWLRIPASPGLYPQTWERLLREEGFCSIVFPARAAHHLGQQVVIAESDGWIRSAPEAPVIETKDAPTTPAPRPVWTGVSASKSSVKQRVVSVLSELLKIPHAQLAEDTPFSDYGVDSIVGVSFVQRVGAALGISLNSAILYDHTTIEGLSAFISASYGDQLQADSDQDRQAPSEPPVAAQPPPTPRPAIAISNREIAVIGMAGQFPGAKDVESLWRNLLEGKPMVGELPAEYLNASTSPSTSGGKPGCRRGGILEDRAYFDPYVFNITPREAESMNPHQRLVMQEGWKALEDAGIDPKGLSGQAAGLFIGAEPCGYEHESFTGSSDAIVASRLSYFLDLKGPALVVNTGCSSSATAIHLACESLRNGESNLALAGGVFAVLSQELLLRLSAMDLLSPTGCCHVFDEAADGTAFSEGVGIVVLKRYADAVADGDAIYGVIEASGMNQDGASNGITAPNGEAQASLVTDIYRRFSIDPERISYIEAHGTGTRLGDPVEANALARAFKQFTNKRHFCAIGSVKSALGHASAAAGVISLIKVLLMLRHGKIPAMRHFSKLNPLIEFNDSAFHVNTATLDWPAMEGKPRVAGLNSFGHSGTNVHMVVRSEEPQIHPSSTSGPWIIVLSAMDDERLKESVERLAAFLESNPSTDVQGTAYTLQVGRNAMRERLAMLIRHPDDLPKQLRAWVKGKQMEDCWRNTVDVTNRAIQLLQSGESSQEMVSRWLSQGDFAKVAELWTLGVNVDWRLLYAHGKPAKVRLPTYPFARKRYWAPRHQVSARLPDALSRPESEDGVLFFSESWEPVQEATLLATATAPNGVGSIVCLVSETQDQEAFRQAIKSIDSQVQLRFITRAEAGQKPDSERLIGLLKNLGPSDALVCLWPMEQRATRTDSGFPFRLLQALAAAKARPSRVVIGSSFEDDLERCHLESWIGIERSVGLILPGVQVSLLLMQPSQGGIVSIQSVAQRVWRMLTAAKQTSVLYANDVPQVLRIRDAQLGATPPLALDDKTVLITGGLGGVGLEMARHLAGKWRVNLALTGRSPLSPGMKDRLASLGPKVGRIEYFQADVCSPIEMENALSLVRQRLGPIHGVVHAAGIRDTRTLFEKQATESQAVIAPKVLGTLNLEKLLGQDPLEFVCYFASSAAVLGDFGACDYAVANRFLVSYANHRNRLVAEGKLRGQTHVICWTMWSGLGMGGDTERDATVFLKSSGQRPLRIEEGLAALEKLLAQRESQHIVLAGNRGRVQQMLGCDATPSASPRTGVTPGTPSRPTTLESIEVTLLSDLKRQLGDLFKIPSTKLGSAQNFADFGIDSIGLTDFARQLSTHYGIGFTPSIFYGHSTLETLAGYLLEKHRSVVATVCSGETTLAGTITPASAAASIVSPSPTTTEPIAIIGMSGRFPGARNIEEMWQILSEGRSSVGVIPADRFDHGALPAGARCGCIPGVKEFDPLFFEISPAEAEEMDPRQRLLLQEGWNALEDAAFGPAALASQRIGMFVGVEEGDYPGRDASGSITSNHTGILASRLAYFLNLNGPVLALNTSCSSSLVAVHQACLSLRAGECDAAVVAGANLLLAPDSFHAMEKAGMLSPDGICFAFDRRANGMVPGEAVVAAVLKPLSRAIADGDPIHAVINGSGINYDGKTNGITAPSGVAQAELVRTVYERAGIKAHQVQYIVTHGTGTRLGDPVELNALLDAFRATSTERAHCALTSCKTNFGHAFAASGLVSLIALVQAMRKQTIPASLNFETRNEFIQWEQSPFSVNTRNTSWPEYPQRPRVGAVSAFGMSGTNAHVVLHDYVPGPATPREQRRAYVLAWSAKTAEGLRERVRRFEQLMLAGTLCETDLAEISNTLLQGRHHFNHRCAIVVKSLTEVPDALKSTLITSAPERPVTHPVQSPADAIDAGEELQSMARRWCDGEQVDWALLFDGTPPRRLHLPTYPFSKREYWLTAGPTPGAPPPAPNRESESFSNPLDQVFEHLATVQTQDMDRLAADLLAATLRSLGLMESDTSLPLQTGEGRAPQYIGRWLKESRRLLLQCPAASAQPLEEVWAEWDRAKTGWLSDSHLKAQTALLERCLRAIPSILRGEQRPTDVLFPNSSTELVEAVYQGNPVADCFNNVVAQAVVASLRQRLAEDPGTRLRILEIGAGTGGTTSAVLPALAAFQERIEEYCYTDISKVFLIHAEERFMREYPFVRTRLFDVSLPARDQQVQPRSYDLVLAANVLHATPNIRLAVRNAITPLRTGGALILSELSANGWFTHLTFGLLEGWWLYQDEALRLQGCPAVSSDTWRQILMDAGFRQVGFPAEKVHCFGQQVITAKDYADTEPVCPPKAIAASSVPQRTAPSLRRAATAYFKHLIGSALKLDPSELEASTPLESYGMDSLMIGRVLTKLREAFKDIPGTLLFELQTIDALTDHFLTNHSAELMERLGVERSSPPAVGDVAPKAANPVVVSARVSQPEMAGTLRSASLATGTVPAKNAREPIAIIGLSGHYPSAPDLRTFWENLKAGKDCIVEVPPERWSLDGFFHPDVQEAIDNGKSYCKWGGFLEGCWNFDPLFFNLSPAGAMETDPQERLFVQAAWEALEDAGYTRNTLAERYEGRVGVFAGIAHAEFNVLGPEQWRHGKRIYPRTSFGSVANRVSFLFNLNGPSIPVDTMCSSALTAIHEACKSILQGECSMAIAGAVNLCLHSSTYVSLCASRLLSKSPCCHSFGIGDDGYVPGEGVGILLLKRLSDAERDGDRIHAIIRGTAVNHGGRTNGYTVPNPNAQAQVIRMALDNAGVNARAVSYVEAHGAGTKLGDPIEVLGLTRAFRQDTADTEFCALGSVKSNVGHLEAAAGMAGLTKVILQMQHKQLVPSLHSATLNPDIKFQETPFVVPQEVTTWEQPRFTSSPVPGPRIAGISAFGAGGSNAHVILEEYTDRRLPCSGGAHPCVIVLSAKNPAQLKEAAGNLQRFVEENPDASLADIAYTLQTGREAMEERLGFVANSLADLRVRIAAFLDGKPGACLRGTSRPGKGGADRFLDEADLSLLMARWLEQGDYAKLLEVWVRGYDVDWNQLYRSGTPPRRIGLPTYPFAKEKYWLPESPEPCPTAAESTPQNSAAQPANSWLFFREEWEPCELDDASNLPDRLAAYQGKRIAVAAKNPADAEHFVTILHGIEAQCGLATPLDISILGSGTDLRLTHAPHIVLFLGPAVGSPGFCKPSEKDLSAVFQLSRSLMNAYWDEPVSIYYLYNSSPESPRVDCEALSGFARAARKENGQHVWRLIQSFASLTPYERARLLINEWLLGSQEAAEIRYTAEKRHVRRLTEISIPSQGRSIFRQNRVYLLAGGMGYLGQELSLELARRYQPTLIFLTRGAVDDSRKAHCRALEKLGARVICESVDITDPQRLETVYRDVVARTGSIHGVFHLARHHEDQMIARKPWESFARVIRPKVDGVLHLDELTANEPLDFFAIFSSLGAYGVRGSSDYSYSTAYQNAFSRLRDGWRQQGKRSGATVSLCWGPWLEDHLFPESRAKLVEAGFALIDMSAGFKILEAALAGDTSPIGLVRASDQRRVKQLLGLETDKSGHLEELNQILPEWEQRKASGEDVSTAIAKRIPLNELGGLPDAIVERIYRLMFGGNGAGNGRATAAVSAQKESPSIATGPDHVLTTVRTTVAEVLQLAELDDDRSFLDYGLDSIAGMQLAVRLEKRLQREVPPQSLIGFPTVALLAKHLTEVSGPTQRSWKQP